jgi:Ca-activated chloride channel family protein
MKRSVIAGLVFAACALADSGVLIPGDRQQPDPAIFSLNEMTLEIRIDNGTARVRMRQIFGNHSGTIEEGTYQFALPAKATVSDFAVWDDVTRIPGVILERRRAGEIYEQTKAQSIDPGLLQMGERTEGESGSPVQPSQEFTARIVPIPPFGTKRIEMEYQHPVAVERYQSEFVIPLKPNVYGLQTTGHLTIMFELHSAHAIKDFAAVSKLYPLRIRERTPNLIKAEYFADNVELKEDLAVRYSLDPATADALHIITERETASGPGFFQAQALLRMPAAQSPSSAPARTLIVLFDDSLSMQWDKLERSFAACETALRRLRPTDSFNLVLFNSQANRFAPQPRTATPENIEQALDFIRKSQIRGGTNLRDALAAALTQTAPGERYLMLISDGGATAGIVQTGKLAAWYAEQWRKQPIAERPHTLVFGVGDDANVSLLQMLARNSGNFDWVRSTEPIEFKLNAFLDKIGQEPVKNLALTAAPASNFDLVYPLEEARYAGSMATWVGEYKKPVPRATFSMTGLRDRQSLRISGSAALPALAEDHPELPRTWAKARVDALLEKIARQGEDQATIDEIIRLSKQYKFVTPYTSFLAVPRALLRPRVIRPGDPVLRLKADKSIASVTALFPFGLIKPLRYLKEEDTWQTRFLVPIDMSDGLYQVRLILRDRDGHVYRESKSFVIASKTPVLRAHLEKTRVHAGETVRISAQASGNARTITARLYGTLPVALHWNSSAKANTGEIAIPAFLPAGRYEIHVTAEDIAHNVGTEEVALEVW